MKYSFELKKEIYEKHCEGYGSDYLSKIYGMDASTIRYMCRLINKHGLDVIWRQIFKSSATKLNKRLHKVLHTLNTFSA